MKNKHLELMSVDELWSLHEEIRGVLSTKLDAEKQELERRLVQLNGRIEKKPRRVDRIRKFVLNTEIQRALRNLVWTRKATALGRCSAKVRKEGRRTSDRLSSDALKS